VICFTEIRRISSEFKKENETDATDEVTGRAMSMEGSKKIILNEAS
jgi:hypothetical protein